ncbi:hypothetical protein GF323_00170 [Candidatus Woesearchaeota archaeon]|nr:hypothetical protein [Candidatus Woesearchaeota archaeon]
MKPKKITFARLASIIGLLSKRSNKATGNYLYKGYRIQVSRYNLSTNQRVSHLYHRRRSKGLCIRCGRKVKKKNARTGKLYRLCRQHRKKDKK